MTIGISGTGISGRDIKELLKLTTRYAKSRKAERVTADMVRKPAQFKGF